MSAPAKIIEVEAFEDDVVGTANNNQPPTVMVEVTSPSKLKGGYTFDAVYNGEVFHVTVPPGGVKAGQTFSAPFVSKNIEAIAVAVAVPLESPALSSETTPMLASSTAPNYNYNDNNNNINNNINNNNVLPTTTSPNNAPLGIWSTELCDWGAEGCCHPSLCNAICFPQILMGQVLTRMKLDWCGNRAGRQAYQKTTCYWILLTIAYLFARVYLRNCTTPTDALETLDLEDIFDDSDNFNHVNHEIKKVAKELAADDYCTKGNRDLLQAINYVWFFLTVFVLMKLRRKVRQAYKISQSCPCCEDLCCAVFCGCCTVAQLARQTADYEIDRAYCCTDTGLAEGFMERQEQQQQQQQHVVCPHGGHVV